MKRISAVICELNPAHEGHRYIFSRAAEEGGTVIAVMSGNFVQRGENAIYDKYKRAKSALDMGADLVVELPFPWSAASAEYFAAASVEIAEKMGAECLVFGSECGDKNALSRAAEFLKGEKFNAPIPGGHRAAEYREKLLHDADPTLPAAILSSANDILGIEYIKNAKVAECIPVKRISCSSATAIRAEMERNRAEYTDAVFTDRLFELEYCKFRTEDTPNFDTAESGGGVGERMYKAASASSSGHEMLDGAKTKQYTNARLRRCGLFHLTDVTVGHIKQLPLFTCVLAINEKGRELLSEMRGKEDFTVITKPSATEALGEEVRKQVKKSQFADSIYTLLMSDIKERDYFVKKSPIIR